MPEDNYPNGSLWKLASGIIVMLQYLDSGTYVILQYSDRLRTNEPGFTIVSDPVHPRKLYYVAEDLPERFQFATRVFDYEIKLAYKQKGAIQE